MGNIQLLKILLQKYLKFDEGAVAWNLLTIGYCYGDKHKEGSFIKAVEREKQKKRSV